MTVESPQDGLDLGTLREFARGMNLTQRELELSNAILDAEFYRPFDQDRWLPTPPWTPDLIPLINWEKAHGHDVRLSCTAGRCAAIGYELDALRAELARKDKALADIAALHVEACESGDSWCHSDGRTWPCETQHILASLADSKDGNNER